MPRGLYACPSLEVTHRVARVNLVPTLVQSFGLTVAFARLLAAWPRAPVFLASRDV